jgi:hypothetical protein
MCETHQAHNSPQKTPQPAAEAIKAIWSTISYFLATNAKDQNDLHDKVKACYAERSNIVPAPLAPSA